MTGIRVRNRVSIGISIERGTELSCTISKDHDHISHEHECSLK